MQQFSPLLPSDKMKTAESGQGSFTPIATTPFSSAFHTGAALAPFASEQTPSLIQIPTTDLVDKRELATSNTRFSLAGVSAVSARKSSSRFIVIPAAKKRTKTPPDPAKPDRHLNLHLRQAVVLVATLLVLGGTLLTLIPLSADQNKSQLSTGLGTLIHSAQLAWQIQSQEVPPTPTPSTQTISALVSAPPPMVLSQSQYVAIAEQDASNVGISPTFFERQINLESGFNPNAVSPGGAEGIAQFEPGTAAGLGINPFDPVQALKAAAQMMANLDHQYDDYSKALAAYNAGSGTLQNAENACGANWLSCMPAETQNYVATIMG
jgi:hypothetical protein